MNMSMGEGENLIPLWKITAGMSQAHSQLHAGTMQRDESPSTTIIANGAISCEHTKLRKPPVEEPQELMVLTTELRFADAEEWQM